VARSWPSWAERLRQVDLADLLLRFYDPRSGTVTIDGRDLRTLRQDSYRRLFGVVPQEALLMNASIRDNITYGREHVTDAAIEQAARIANAHDFVTELPDGYATVSAIAACGCPAASASAWPSPAPSWPSRRSCCSTKRRAPWTASPSGWCSRPSTGHHRAHVRRHRAPALDRHARRRIVVLQARAGGGRRPPRRADGGESDVSSTVRLQFAEAEALGRY